MVYVGIFRKLDSLEFFLLTTHQNLDGSYNEVYHLVNTEFYSFFFKLVMFLKII